MFCMQSDFSLFLQKCLHESTLLKVLFNYFIKVIYYRIHSVTWNVNARDMPQGTDLSHILGPKENYQQHKVDVFAVG